MHNFISIVFNLCPINQISTATKMKAMSTISLHASTDGISCARFTPSSSKLLVTTWDGGVTLYDVASGLMSSRAEANGPVLCGAVDPRSDGVVYSGGLDRVVNMWDVQSGKALEAIGSHENGVRCMEWAALNNTLVTGGWDSCVRVWDTRTRQTSQQAQITIRASSKIFAMDVHESHVAIGQQDGTVRIYDVKKADAPVIDRVSTLGHQIRCLRYFDKGTGLASGSTEGRVALENTGVNVSVKRYTFKCHRANEKIYPVNCLAFNPVATTIFATGGGDGSVSVWDEKAQKRLYCLDHFPTSISSCEFSHDGTLLAVAVSYTFERGNVDHPVDELLVFSHDRELEEAQKNEEA